MKKKYVVTMLCTDTDNTYYNDIIEQEFETKEIYVCKNKFIKRMSLDSCTDPCIAFLLDTFASIVEDILTIFDNGLIAAAAKCKVDGHAGILVILVVGRGCVTDTDT